MGALHFNEETQVNDCAPHITFTSNGYFNKPHRDDQDISQFAFLLVAPVEKRTGILCETSDHCGITGGPFIFPDLGFGIDFAEQNGIVKMAWAANRYRHFTLPANESSSYGRMAMSLQIPKDSKDNCEAIQTGAVYSRPKNIGNEHMLYYGDHNHLMQSTSKHQQNYFFFHIFFCLLYLLDSYQLSYTRTCYQFLVYIFSIYFIF